MSTNRNKLYFNSDIKISERELKKALKLFTRKTQGRKTIQIRVSEKWYRKLKEVAESEDVMLSFMLDHICEHYFKHN